MKELKMTQDILFYSLKYALNRYSTAPTEVANNIIRNLKDIDDGFLERFVTEINKKEYPDDTSALWISLAKDINYEITLRKQL